MRCLKIFLLLSVLLFASFSASAFSCVNGGFGHCIIGVDKNAPRDGAPISLINPALFLAFCDSHDVYCSADEHGNSSIMGRYLEDDVFILANRDFGGPDLILENKALAEQFINEFNRIVPKAGTYFYIKHGSYPVLGMVAIGYKSREADASEEIKLLFLPNEKGDTGDGHPYVEPDMLVVVSPWGSGNSKGAK